MSKVSEGIYIGDWHNAQDLNFLKRHKITHILCLASELREIFPKKFKYKKLPIVDNSGFKIINYFDEATEFIHKAIKNRKPSKNPFSRKNSNSSRRSRMSKQPSILIHCSNGNSRSCTIAIAYLIKYQKINFETAFSIIKRLRKNSMPNLGFVLQLRKYEKKLMKMRKMLTLYEKQKQGKLQTSENREKKRLREEHFIETVFQKKSSNPFIQSLETGDQVTSQLKSSMIPKLDFAPHSKQFFFPSRNNSRKSLSRKKSRMTNKSHEQSPYLPSNLDNEEAEALVVRLPGAARSRSRSRNNSVTASGRKRSRSRSRSRLSRNGSEKNFSRKSSRGTGKYWKLRKPRPAKSQKRVRRKRSRSLGRNKYFLKNSKKIFSRRRNSGSVSRVATSTTLILQRQSPLPSERKLAILQEPIKDLLKKQAHPKETSKSRSRSKFMGSDENYTRIFDTSETFGSKASGRRNKKENKAFTLAAGSRREVFHRRKSLETHDSSRREIKVSEYIEEKSREVSIKRKRKSKSKLSKGKVRSKSRYQKVRSKPKILARLKKNYDRSVESKNMVEKFTFGVKRRRSKSKKRSSNKPKKFIKYKKKNFDELRKELGLEEESVNTGYADFSMDKENCDVNVSKSFKRFMEIGDFSECTEREGITERRRGATGGYDFGRKTRWFEY